MDRVNGTSHVPAFLAKLWKIVDDPSTNDLICWTESGRSFIIRNQSKFARELLPLYYKHNNMASFVRQLNMYGFHKVLSVEQGGLRLDKDEMEFAHEFFVQGNEGALEFIKRKISTSKIEDLKGRPEWQSKVMMDVRQIKGRQEDIDSKLVEVKRENEALWRELSQLRQKHSKQQQIVSKLLQFLVSMMSSQSHRISFKRRMPLMLSDVDSKPAKLSRSTKTEQKPLVETDNGPVIHEVFESEEPMSILNMPDETQNEFQPTDERMMNCELMKVEDLLSTAVTETIGDSPKSSPMSIMVLEDGSHVLATAGSPVSENSSQEVTTTASSDVALLGNDLSMQLSRPQQLSAPGSNAGVKPRVILPNDLDSHLDEVQIGLDSLKDLLQGTTYNIDQSTLSGLFGVPENDLPLFELTREDRNEKKGKDFAVGLTLGSGTDGVGGSGSDLVSYNPCLFELAEDDSQFFDNDNMFLDEELDMMLTTDHNKLSNGAVRLSP